MSLTRSLPDVKPGQLITASRFNRVQRLASGVRTSGASISLGGDDHFRSISSVSEGGVKSVRFTIQVVEHDYLRGFETEDAAANGGDETEYFVAKPYKLRRTPWDGNTFQVKEKSITYNYQTVDRRLAVAEGDEDEDQRIVGPYLVDDIIDILRVQRDTGVDTVDQQAGSVRRIDLNTDGRMWGYLFPEA